MHENTSLKRSYLVHVDHVLDPPSPLWTDMDNWETPSLPLPVHVVYECRPTTSTTKKLKSTSVIASKLTNVSNVLKFTKAMFWYYCFENKTWLSANRIVFPPGGENNLIGQSDYFPSWRENDLIGCSFCVSTHMILITNSHWLLKWLHRMMKFHCERGYKYPCFFNKLIHYLLIFLCVNNLFQNLRILGLVNFHRIFLQ